MQELDLLLQRYLACGWPSASSAERAEFVAFLELPDPELEGYLLKGEVAPDAGFAHIATRILASATQRAAGPA
jgi:succinate dehydrogenase flavin-adding protein (antitoxin of CptAB toxin-antitoxin module)